MKITEVDVLRVLGNNEMSGYSISQMLEKEAVAAGKKERFLFWMLDPVVPFGHLYRVIDSLVDKGIIKRSEKSGRYSARWTNV